MNDRICTCVSFELLNARIFSVSLLCFQNMCVSTLFFTFTHVLIMCTERSARCLFHEAGVAKAHTLIKLYF